MSVSLLTEHHLDFLSLKGGCTGSSESTLVKIPHCWKSHVAAHTRFTMSVLCILFQMMPLGWSAVCDCLQNHHFEFLSLKGGCTGSSESTLVKIPHCWKSLVMAQIVMSLRSNFRQKERNDYLTTSADYEEVLALRGHYFIIINFDLPVK